MKEKKNNHTLIKPTLLYTSILLLLLIALLTLTIQRISQVTAEEPVCSIEEAEKEVEPGETAFCFSKNTVYKIYKRADGSLLIYKHKNPQNEPLPLQK